MSTALTVAAAGGPFLPRPFTDEAVRPDEVRLAVSYCGICHTDVHLVRDEWGASSFPMVPGHEIAGTVVEIGGAVTTLAVGDRVGVSTFVDSCRECRQCVEGLEQYCARGEVLTYNDRHYDGRPTSGGFRTSMTVDEHYAVPVPAEVPLELAAPLMCAGTTVWSPLRAWATGAGSRVGVIGLGGLGHLAVKLARSLGAEVTVVSRDRTKAAAAWSLGATQHLTQAEAAERSEELDLVLNTVGELPALDGLLGLLGQDGTWVDVGVPTTPREIRWDRLAAGRRRYTASKIGSLEDMRTLLAHVARTGVRPDVTVVGADQVEAAFDVLSDGSAPHRFVLDVATITQAARAAATRGGVS